MNTMLGSRLYFSQTVALLAMMGAIMSLVLLSFATITLFFMLTGGNYLFVKILNVLFFGIAGLAGIGIFRGAMRRLALVNRMKAGTIVNCWIVVFLFVGCQMAWVLRPFMGSEYLPFQLFRKIQGNFFENVFVTVWQFLSQFGERVLASGLD
jgi:hypothetical protein